MSVDNFMASILLDHPFTLDLMLLSSMRESTDDAKQFDLDSLDRDECLHRFRFDHHDLARLKSLFNIPDVIRCGQHAKQCSGIEALCILLRRLVYPNRLKDLEKEFGYSSQNLSEIFNFMLRYVYRTFYDKLFSLDQPWFDRQHLEVFSAAIQRKGAPLNRCWGFIDGTVRPICRPSRHQRIVYNGHKRIHALKYQTVTTPNGLVANIYGPMPGRRHDSYMLAESNLLNKLQDLQPYYLYADSGYPMSNSIITPYKPARTEVEENFNNIMSSIRVTVEWPYGKVIQLFAFVDFKKNHKLFLQPVGLYYLIACFLTNCHTCIYGSEGSQYFGLQPPTLEEYLNIG